MIGNAYDGIVIIFNEEEQVYELFIDDSLNYKGSFSEVSEHLGEYFLNDEDWCAEDDEEAEETVNECMSILAGDEDINAYMLRDLSDDLKHQKEIDKLVLDFACDVLDIMKNSKRELFGAEPELRKSIRYLAYNEIQELIDKYSDKVINGGHIDE